MLNCDCRYVSLCTAVCAYLYNICEYEMLSYSVPIANTKYKKY